jgi:hypothetical protein
VAKRWIACGKLKECLVRVETVLGAVMISVRNALEHGMNMANAKNTKLPASCEKEELF